MPSSVGFFGLAALYDGLHVGAAWRPRLYLDTTSLPPVFKSQQLLHGGGGTDWRGLGERPNDGRYIEGEPAGSTDPHCRAGRFRCSGGRQKRWELTPARLSPGLNQAGDFDLLSFSSSHTTRMPAIRPNKWLSKET